MACYPCSGLDAEPFSNIVWIKMGPHALFCPLDSIISMEHQFVSLCAMCGSHIRDFNNLHAALWIYKQSWWRNGSAGLYFFIITLLKNGLSHFWEALWQPWQCCGSGVRLTTEGISTLFLLSLPYSLACPHPAFSSPTMPCNTGLQAAVSDHRKTGFPPQAVVHLMLLFLCILLNMIMFPPYDSVCSRSPFGSSKVTQSWGAGGKDGFVIPSLRNCLDFVNWNF